MPDRTPTPSSPPAPLSGTVLAREGSRFRVATPQGEVHAVLLGKVKQGEPRVVAGDEVTLEGDGIAAVAPRRSVLERRMPHGRGVKPIAANIDEVLVVTAARDPAPIPQLLDRLLAVAEVNSLPATVLINKIDLDPGDALAERFRKAGYRVMLSSVADGTGIDAVRAHLVGRTTVLTGPSGAGKSSLANAVQPGLGLRVGAISARLKRGRQTTVSAVMIPLELGGFLVDTPGFSEVGLWGVVPRELARCFPEMREPLEHCRFPDCSHRHEPGCAVREAVEQGRIAGDRWESYQRLLHEVESEPKEWE